MKKTHKKLIEIFAQISRLYEEGLVCEVYDNGISLEVNGCFCELQTDTKQPLVDYLKVQCEKVQTDLGFMCMDGDDDRDGFDEVSNVDSMKLEPGEDLEDEDDVEYWEEALAALKERFGT